MLNELSQQIHKGNVERGFYEDEKNIGEMLALIHSEVSEALECDRNSRFAKREYLKQVLDIPIDNNVQLINFKNKFEGAIKDTFEDELADIIIRVLDLAAFRRIDIESHIRAKIKYNSTRPYKHGKKY